MRVLLVSPNDPADRRFGPPKMGLGLAYLAAAVRRAGHEVRVLDKWAEHRLAGLDRARTARLLDQALAGFAPDLVGLQAHSRLIADTLRDARRVKALSPRALVVLGGPHVTALPEETLRRHPFVDVVVLGEGEDALRALADGAPLAAIDGIAHVRDGAVVRTRRRLPAADLDALPRPARDLMPMAYYTLPSREAQSRGRHRYATILSSRGCVGACSFCLQGTVRRPLALRAPGEVVAEMEEVLRDHPQVEAFEFLDPLFLAHPPTTEALCRELIRSGLHRRVRWKAQTRADPRDAALYRLLREAGCFLLGFGFESGSPRVLEAMGKRIRVADVFATTEAARRAGLLVDAYFVYGHPAESEEDFLATLEVLHALRPDWAGYGRYFVVPGTRDYARLRDRAALPLRWDDPAVDWEDERRIAAGAARNLSRIPDARFARLERLAFRAVVGPLNVRHQLRVAGPRALLSPRLLAIAARTWLASRPPWLAAARAWARARAAARRLTARGTEGR